MNKVIAFLAPALLLAACTSTNQERPEPIIQTVEVQVPIDVPCPKREEVGERINTPDTEEALRRAPNLFERVKLLMMGRELRTTRLDRVEDAIDICNQSE